MSSGKSTVINAAIGKHVLPTSNNACTVFPISITHTECLEGEIMLEIPKRLLRSMNSCMCFLRKVLENKKDFSCSKEQIKLLKTKRNNIEVIREKISEEKEFIPLFEILKKKKFKFTQHYFNIKEIRKILVFLNQIGRLIVSNFHFLKFSPNNVISSMNEFPKIFVKFLNFGDEFSSPKRPIIRFIDSPGLDDEKMKPMKSIVDKVFSSCDLNVLVIDTVEDEKSADIISNSCRKTLLGNQQLFILINKFDIRLQEYQNEKMRCKTTDEEEISSEEEDDNDNPEEFNEIMEIINELKEKQREICDVMEKKNSLIKTCDYYFGSVTKKSFNELKSKKKVKVFPLSALNAFLCRNWEGFSNTYKTKNLMYGSKSVGEDGIFIDEIYNKISFNKFMFKRIRKKSKLEKERFFGEIKEKIQHLKDVSCFEDFLNSLQSYGVKCLTKKRRKLQYLLQSFIVKAINELNLRSKTHSKGVEKMRKIFKKVFQKDYQNVEKVRLVLLKSDKLFLENYKAKNLYQIVLEFMKDVYVEIFKKEISQMKVEKHKNSMIQFFQFLNQYDRNEFHIVLKGNNSVSEVTEFMKEMCVHINKSAKFFYNEWKEVFINRMVSLLSDQCGKDFSSKINNAFCKHVDMNLFHHHDLLLFTKVHLKEENFNISLHTLHLKKFLVSKLEKKMFKIIMSHLRIICELLLDTNTLCVFEGFKNVRTKIGILLKK